MRNPTFDEFKIILDAKCALFSKNFLEYQKPSYSEAALRKDFLDPVFEELGWDLQNERKLIPSKREVEIESRTDVEGRRKRADYLFRIDGQDSFICEAKKPNTKLDAKEAFQAKRYAWNKNLPIAILSDFEDLKVYIVGNKPHPDDGENMGLWKKYNYSEYSKKAEEIWHILSRYEVANGGLQKIIDSLPKKASGRGRIRQQWLIRPDRNRALDTDFLNFLDEARRTLATDLLNNNDRKDLLADNRLNEATHRTLDRLLFLRICEDRDINTGKKLEFFLKESNIWNQIVVYFRALDRRPPSHIPFFNGNLFKTHFSEELIVSDEWLTDFIHDISAEESPYLFNAIPVEILGTIYERFLGKTIRPQGKGVIIEEKPEVRKAGGVYYTPRYIVDYIVEQTVGKLIENKTPAKTLNLKILDPACGSGSFLIRSFERMCEHWEQWLLDHPTKQKGNWYRKDKYNGDIRLTVKLKKKILQNNIFGVDLDPGAVEVSQLALYLKLLEGENDQTIQLDLFGNDEPLLPSMNDNIKCGNSLIASDFSIDPDELIRVRAFDWDVQFSNIMKGGGFDVIVGNPPYIRPHKMDLRTKEYFWQSLKTFVAKSDIYSCFMEKGVNLLRADGYFGFIVPHTWTSLESFENIRRKLVTESEIILLVQLPKKVFQHAAVETCIFAIRKCSHEPRQSHQINVVRLTNTGKRANIRSFLQTDIARGHLYNFQLYAKTETSEFAERLKTVSKPLSSVVEFAYGFKTAADDKFIHSDARYKESKPFIRSAAVHRYYHDFAKDFVWYVPGKMKEHRKTARPGEAERFESEKLVVARMGKELIACYDEGGLYVKDAMLLLPMVRSDVSLKYLLALINSRLLSYFYKEYFITIDVLKNAILDLPIHSIDLSNPRDKACHDKLVELVNRMNVLMPKLKTVKSTGERETLQNAVTATDQKIDTLVYELYALTPDEIKIVESKTR